MGNKKFMFFGLTAIVVIVTAIVVLASMTVRTNQELDEVRAAVDTQTIYDNIYIEGIHVGGKTKEEARTFVESEINRFINEQALVMVYGGEQWSIALNELDYSFDVDAAVDSAFDIARKGNQQERYETIESLKENPVEIEIKKQYNHETVLQRLEEIAQSVNVAPVSAAVRRENKQFVVTEGAVGQTLNQEETLALAMEALDRFEGAQIELIIEETAPQYMAADLENAKSLLGSFSTPVTGSPSRDVNLTVAAEKINGMVLMPGEIFSTNDAIGPTTYENGYRVAPVIVNGKLTDGIGGGVCQVSSTLYNTVLFSELEIVERQNHSLAVGYVTIGRDATLAGDYIDFKFKNDTAYPITIESYLEGKQLVVNIYGHETRPANRTLTFDSAVVGTTAPGPEVVTQDPSLPEGTRQVTLAAITGRTVVVHKNVLVDGQVVERVQVNTSVYRPRAAEVTVGTKAAAPSTEEQVPVPGNETQEVPVVPESNTEQLENQDPPAVTETEPPVADPSDNAPLMED